MAFILFGSFFALILLGVPIAYCLGVSSIIAMLVCGFNLAVIPGVIYSGIGKFTLLAIPFFVLAGVIMDYAGISKRLIRLAAVFLGHLRGGLAVITVVVSAFFAAISGSGPATVAALGPTLIPAMEEAGYKKDWSAALLANSGNMGIIIPPSIIMVIYGVLSGASITRIFMAGIIPGLLFAVALILVAYMSLNKNSVKIEKGKKSSARERWDAFKDAIWGILTPVIILGGIYGGIVTPTEAAGIAVVYGLFVGVVIYREIKLRDLWSLFVDASVSSASVLFIAANAALFAWVLSTTRLAITVSAALIGMTSSKILLLVIMNVILLVAGCFMDSASSLYVFVPIMLPIVSYLNIDLVSFGIIMTINLAIGMTTPPVGIDLFVACNVAKVNISDISKQTIKFVLASIAVLAILSAFPQVITFLPNLFGMK